MDDLHSAAAAILYPHSRYIIHVSILGARRMKDRSHNNIVFPLNGANKYVEFARSRGQTIDRWMPIFYSASGIKFR